MRLRLIDQPLILVFVACAALSMMVPAAVALAMEEFHTARTFFYAALLGIIVTWLIALARGRRSWTGRNTDLIGLLSLLATYALVPAYFAVPFQESVRATSFLNAYLEMVSALTTTGAPLFEPGRLSPVLELWRAQVGWMGGLLIWVAAAAVLAPLNLGGFEVTWGRRGRRARQLCRQVPARRHPAPGRAQLCPARADLHRADRRALCPAAHQRRHRAGRALPCHVDHGDQRDFPGRRPAQWRQRHRGRDGDPALPRLRPLAGELYHRHLRLALRPASRPRVADGRAHRHRRAGAIVPASLDRRARS